VPFAGATAAVLCDSLGRGIRCRSLKRKAVNGRRALRSRVWASCRAIVCRRVFHLPRGLIAHSFNCASRRSRSAKRLEPPNRGTLLKFPAVFHHRGPYTRFRISKSPSRSRSTVADHERGGASSILRCTVIGFFVVAETFASRRAARRCGRQQEEDGDGNGSIAQRGPCWAGDNPGQQGRHFFAAPCAFITAVRSSTKLRVAR